MPGTGGPWGTGEMETTLAPVRALMRSGDVVAHSTLTEGRSDAGYGDHESLSSLQEIVNTD